VPVAAGADGLLVAALVTALLAVLVVVERLPVTRRTVPRVGREPPDP
jgi:hypothetical protein